MSENVCPKCGGCGGLDTPCSVCGGTGEVTKLCCVEWELAAEKQAHAETQAKLEQAQATCALLWAVWSSAVSLLKELEGTTLDDDDAEAMRGHLAGAVNAIPAGDTSQPLLDRLRRAEEIVRALMNIECWSENEQLVPLVEAWQAAAEAARRAKT